jgi:hypothetical protein
MKVASLIKIIDSARDLYQRSGDNLRANALDHLEKMLGQHKNKLLSTILNALQQSVKIAHLQQYPVKAHRVEVVRNALQGIQSIFAAGRADTVAKSLAALDSALAPFDKCQVRDVASFVASALKGHRRKQLDMGTVNRYVAELRGTADAERFVAAIDQLSKDRAASVLETNAIAEQFTGQKKDYRSKPAAVTAMENAFLESLRGENKSKSNE